MIYLLTGGSGVLGSELQKQASSYGIKFIAPTREELDIADKKSIDRYLRKNCIHMCSKIAGIVHCAAYTDVPGAEENMEDAIWTNIYGTDNVVFYLGGNLGAKIIYISTDYVYPGTSGNYKETDSTSPVNFYAFTKLAGEAFLNKWQTKDLIIRTSFKPNKPWPFERAFDDLYTSSDYVDIIAPKILHLIGNNGCLSNNCSQVLQNTQETLYIIITSP